MKKFFVLLYTLLAVSAHAALPTNMDSVTVGTYLRPKATATPLGSSTAFWNAYLSTILGQVTTDTSTGNVDALATTDRYQIRLTGAAPVLRGMAGGAAGKELVIINATGLDFAVKNDDSNPSVGNKILTGTGSDLTLPADAAFRFAYDATTGKWRVAGGGGGTAFTAIAPLDYDTGTKELTCDVASGSQPGCLASADFNTFNGKQANDADLDAIAALSGTGYAARSASNTWVLRTLGATAPITVSNGDGTSGNPTIACNVASGSQPGCLASADFNTFNGKQAQDADLDALAANSTDGFWAHTGAGTGAARTLTQPAAGLTIANAAGIAGNPTFALANDLAALEGLGSTGFAARTGSDTWAQRTLTQPAAGLTIANAAGIAGDPTFALANDLAALEGLSSTGFAVRSATDTWLQRVLQAGSGISIANNDGISGNPVITATIKPSLNIATLDTAANSWAVSKPDNYDAEGSVGDWLAYADAAATTPVDLTGGSPNTTCTRNTSSPINGTGDFKVTVTTGASRQGEGCAIVLNIPPAYRGKPIRVVAPYTTTGTISQGDFVPYAYDVTNASLLVPSATISGINSTAGNLYSIFQTQTSTAQLRFGLHIARSSNTGAATVNFDDFTVEPDLDQANVPMSDWVAYTPTFTNFGTVSTSSFWWRRVGDSVEIRGSFTTGTTAGSTAAISLPNSIIADSAKIPSLAVVGEFWYGTSSNATSPSLGCANLTGGDTTLKFGVRTASNDCNSQVAGSTLIGSTVGAHVHAIIPISGWSSGGGTSPILSLSDWATQTVTPASGAFGTVSNNSWKSRRVGDTMEITGYFTAGTVAGGIASLDIGNNIKIDSSKLGTTIHSYLQGACFELIGTGYFRNGEANVVAYPFFDGSDTDTIFLAIASGSSTAFTKNLGTDMQGNGGGMACTFRFPVAGWTATSSGTLTAPRSYVRLHTYAGYGSTATRKPYFTTTSTVGNALTITTNSSTTGNLVTVNLPGMYAANAWCMASNAAPAFASIMRNTTGIDNGSTVPEDAMFTNGTYRLSSSGTGDGATPSQGNATWVGFLNAAETLEIRTRGGVPGTAALCYFEVTQIGY